MCVFLRMCTTLFVHDFAITMCVRTHHAHNRKLGKLDVESRDVPHNFSWKDISSYLVLYARLSPFSFSHPSVRPSIHPSIQRESEGGGKAR